MGDMRQIYHHAQSVHFQNYQLEIISFENESTATRIFNSFYSYLSKFGQIVNWMSYIYVRIVSPGIETNSEKEIYYHVKLSSPEDVPHESGRNVSKNQEWCISPRKLNVTSRTKHILESNQRIDVNFIMKQKKVRVPYHGVLQVCVKVI